jgi:adenine-specific DNA-methyltransferase
VLHLTGGKTVEFKNLRIPGRALDLHATADIDSLDGKPTPVAIVFGPENGAVTEQFLMRSVKEANAKNYTQLFVIGFAIQDAATRLLKNSMEALGLPVTYAQATMDIQMGDLLKTTRSSQLFSVLGLPDVKLVRLSDKNAEGDSLYRIRLLAVDTFDPVTMEPNTISGDQVPCWLLDSDYDELCFRANQVFFPRTGAWDNLRRSLKGTYSDTVWDHLAGVESTNFVGGKYKRVAIKVVDDRGNELLVVKDLSEAVVE